MTRISLNDPNTNLGDALRKLQAGGGPIIFEGPGGEPLGALVSAEEALAIEAEKRFGVRPRRIVKGRPVYTEDEMKNPAFRWPYPPEDDWAQEVESANALEKPAK